MDGKVFVGFYRLNYGRKVAVGNFDLKIPTENISLVKLLVFSEFLVVETQVDVVLACCIIHNHIMGVDPNDFLMEEICSEREPIRRTINLSQREEREENREWITKREMIASIMWNDYNTQIN